MGLVGISRLVVVLALSLSGARAFADDLVAAVLPLSRSPSAGQAATAFATVINASGRALSGCNVSLPNFSGTFTYRTTNPATNAVVGGINQTFPLANGAAQTLLVSLQSSSTLPPTDEHLVFQCTGSTAAASIIGVNTLLLSVGATATPDVVALGATPTADGTLKASGVGAAAAFSVASVNVGTTGSITVTADTGDIALPISVSLCQTNPLTGVCTNPSTPGSSAIVTINANATPTFSFFVTANAPIPFFPATTRLFVRYKDAGGVTRGSTSIALNSNTTLAAGQTAGGIYSGVYRVTSGQSLGASGAVQFIISESGTLAGITADQNNQFAATAVSPNSSLLYNATGIINSSDANGIANLTVNGAVSPRQLIAGLYSFAGNIGTESGQFYASYNASLYERASSLAMLAGSWNLRQSDGTMIGTATITAAGAISASAPGAGAGCTASGSASIINASYNAYSVSLTPSSACGGGGGGNGAATGLGSLFDKNSTNDSFQIFLLNSSGVQIAANLTKF